MHKLTHSSLNGIQSSTVLSITEMLITEFSPDGARVAGQRWQECCTSRYTGQYSLFLKNINEEEEQNTYQQHLGRQLASHHS
jgi:hypothetical protein